MNDLEGDPATHPDRRRTDRDADRELSEVVDELRVVLPATTLLFGFLVTLPFSTNFAQMSQPARVAFFVAFVASALAIVVLLGETAYHRLQGRPYDKLQMVDTAGHQLVVALLLLAVAMGAVVLLVLDVVYELSVGVAVAAGVLSLAVVVWLVIPLVRRYRTTNNFTTKKGHGPAVRERDAGGPT